MKRPVWLRATASTYGAHALDAEGHCHTKEPDADYVGQHRPAEEPPGAGPSWPQTNETPPPGMTG